MGFWNFHLRSSFWDFFFFYYSFWEFRLGFLREFSLGFLKELLLGCLLWIIPPFGISPGIPSEVSLEIYSRISPGVPSVAFQGALSEILPQVY